MREQEDLMICGRDDYQLGKVTGKQGKPVQVLQIGKKCIGAHPIAFCLLGYYPKPFEFFKLHFEEATPSANNLIKLTRADFRFWKSAFLMFA